MNASRKTYGTYSGLLRSGVSLTLLLLLFITFLFGNIRYQQPLHQALTDELHQRLFQAIRQLNYLNIQLKQEVEILQNRLEEQERYYDAKN